MQMDKSARFRICTGNIKMGQETYANCYCLYLYLCFSFHLFLYQVELSVLPEADGTRLVELLRYIHFSRSKTFLSLI